jgi:hypothetical protein
VIDEPRHVTDVKLVLSSQRLNSGNLSHSLVYTLYPAMASSSLRRLLASRQPPAPGAVARAWIQRSSPSSSPSSSSSSSASSPSVPAELWAALGSSHAGERKHSSPRAAGAALARLHWGLVQNQEGGTKEEDKVVLIAPRAARGSGLSREEVARRAISERNRTRRVSLLQWALARLRGRDLREELQAQQVGGAVAKFETSSASYSHVAAGRGSVLRHRRALGESAEAQVELAAALAWFDEFVRATALEVTREGSKNRSRGGGGSSGGIVAFLLGMADAHASGLANGRKAAAALDHDSPDRVVSVPLALRAYPSAEVEDCVHELAVRRDSLVEVAGAALSQSRDVEATSKICAQVAKALVDDASSSSSSSLLSSPLSLPVALSAGLLAAVGRRRDWTDEEVAEGICTGVLPDLSSMALRAALAAGTTAGAGAGAVAGGVGGGGDHDVGDSAVVVEALTSSTASALCSCLHHIREDPLAMYDIHFAEHVVRRGTEWRVRADALANVRQFSPLVSGLRSEAMVGRWPDQLVVQGVRSRLDPPWSVFGIAESVARVFHRHR